MPPETQATAGNKPLLGQVGGFPLRLSWLPRLFEHKGLSGTSGDMLEKHALELGMGRNMVKALRFWGLSCGMIKEDGALSPRAELLFKESGGVDPFLEKHETLWILHWLISSNASHLTAASWLFCFYHERFFLLADAVKSFQNFLAAKGQIYAEGTVRVDVETALRMYANAEGQDSDYETDDKAFQALGLISSRRLHRGISYTREFSNHADDIPAIALSYSLMDSFFSRKATTLSFSDLYAHSHFPPPGSVFGLTRDGFLAALENLAAGSRKMVDLTAMPGDEFNVSLSDYARKFFKQGGKGESPADAFLRAQSF